MSREFLTFSDLTGLGSSPAALKDEIGRRKGATPSGLALNNSVYFDAVTPAITQQYGHYCYKQVGTYSFTNEGSSVPKDVIIGSNEAINDGDKPITVNLTVQGQYAQSTAYSSSITAGMGFEESVGVEGMFSAGVSFSLSVTAGSSNSSSESKLASSSVTVEVPPKSKKQIQMVGTFQTETLNCKIPINVSGYVGANYKPQLNGHYFWFWPIEDFVPKTSGVLDVSIKGVMAVHFYTKVGPTVPIK